MRNEEKNSLNSVTFIDLFAGIGAFRTALESFGAKCVFSSEWDYDAQNTYEMNYGERPLGDITKIDEKDIPKHDILCAGFPCQPFSISGKQLGFADTRGTLFFDVVRIVKKHKPSIILLENVKNFASHDNGRTLFVVTNTLNDLGYDVYHDILNAANYGIPQKRERIFFVCFKKEFNVKKFNFPKPIALVNHLCDYLLSDEETSEFVINREDIFMKDNVVEHYSNTALRIGIVNKGGQGERIYSPMGTAITLSAYGGGVGAKTGLYLVNGKVRRLAPRECARIEGFPDTFKLPDNKNIAFKQFGNSIVVDVLQYIIREIILCGKKENIIFFE
ncbi:MAG: DNA cytosine methyltransferase [Clostridia bacterium]|nr:DNA cytosine methyltransferase [Clostridia bacterium]